MKNNIWNLFQSSFITPVFIFIYTTVYNTWILACMVFYNVQNSVFEYLYLWQFYVKFIITESQRMRVRHCVEWETDLNLKPLITSVIAFFSNSASSDVGEGFFSRFRKVSLLFFRVVSNRNLKVVKFESNIWWKKIFIFDTRNKGFPGVNRYTNITSKSHFVLIFLLNPVYLIPVCLVISPASMTASISLYRGHRSLSDLPSIFHTTS